MDTCPDLEAIAARADLATPAPWHVEHGRVYAGDPNDHDALALASMLGSRPWLADADFMAHARQDIPDLLAALAAETARADTAADDAQLGADMYLVALRRARSAERRISAAGLIGTRLSSVKADVMNALLPYAAPEPEREVGALVAEVRKIAATLTSPAEIHTLLYAADRIADQEASA